MQTILRSANNGLNRCSINMASSSVDRFLLTIEAWSLAISSYFLEKKSSTTMFRFDGTTQIRNKIDISCGNSNRHRWPYLSNQRNPHSIPPYKNHYGLDSSSSESLFERIQGCDWMYFSALHRMICYLEREDDPVTKPSVVFVLVCTRILISFTSLLMCYFCSDDSWILGTSGIGITHHVSCESFRSNFWSRRTRGLTQKTQNTHGKMTTFWIIHETIHPSFHDHFMINDDQPNTCHRLVLKYVSSSRDCLDLIALRDPNFLESKDILSGIAWIYVKLTFILIVILLHARPFTFRGPRREQSSRVWRMDSMSQRGKPNSIYWISNYCFSSFKIRARSPTRSFILSESCDEQQGSTGAKEVR